MSIMEVTPRGLDIHWKQAPVTLEDALGNLIPIPLELVNSWDMFETLLTKRFEILKGHKKVARKEYAIEDSRSHRQLDSKTEWGKCVRPGAKLDMFMVFKQRQTSTSCPGCLTESDSSDGSMTKCKRCHMWFQRIEEIIEPSLGLTSHVAEIPTLSSGSPTSEINIAEVSDDSPSDFTRVKIVYQGHRWGPNIKHLKPIQLNDPMGRKFSFPFHLCYHWRGMEQLVSQSCRYNENIGTHVANGRYDLVCSNGEKILPQDWEATIEPGDTISMHMWPISEVEMMREKRASQLTSKEINDQEVEDSGTAQKGVALSKDDIDNLSREASPEPVVSENRKLKGILRISRHRFPEDPIPIREDVAPLNRSKGDSTIPPDARWTKISRRLVNPEALEAGKERYEARDDFVIVLRVLTREEIQAYADATQQIRAARGREELEELERSDSQHMLEPNDSEQGNSSIVNDGEDGSENAFLSHDDSETGPDH